MSTKGKDCGGIRDMDGIKRRCRIEEDGCWEYLGQPSRKTGGILVWLAHEKRTTTLGAAVGLFKTGKRPPKGMLWVATCGNPRCANPAHRQLHPAGRQSQIAAEHGRNGGLLRVQRVRAARRANSKWSDADIAAIRQDEGTLTERARKYGMSVSHCHRVLRGESRPDLSAFGIAMRQLCAEPA